MTITAGLLSAQHLGPFRPIPCSSGKISFTPKEPKEGEIVTVVFEFTSSVDAAELHVSCIPHLDTKVESSSHCKGPIKKGETRRYILGQLGAIEEKKSQTIFDNQIPNETDEKPIDEKGIGRIIQAMVVDGMPMDIPESIKESFKNLLQFSK